MTDQPLHTPDRQPEDPDAALRPKSLGRVRRAGGGAREPARVHRGRAQGRGEAMDHVLFFGPPGLGKTTLAQIVASELGVGFRATSGPVIAKAGDLAALLTNLEPQRRAVHRRDPPPQSGGRGSALSGDGGPRARHHHRRGAVGAQRADRPAAVHADRRDHAAGPADHAAARPFRHPGAAEFLHRRRTGAGRHPRGAAAGHGDRSRRRARDRPPRRAARRASPGRLLRRVRDFAHVAGARHRHRARSPTRR